MRFDENETDPFIIMSHFYLDAMRVFTKRVGMSFSRIDVMHELFHAGEISQMELQRRLDMEGALMTRFAKQMEAEGLVMRRVDPKDNRYTLIKLSPAGEALLDKMDELGSAYQTQLMEGIDDEELVILAKVLKRLYYNLSRME
ncbi:MAG TPA: MarR family transcriptional regulator [Phototrophicaceae bacterium]|jgi:DNA-binding MarR family transcriptional regulator|nr:MarR family transcriptional regulator [Phototrophicaceae bacterium]